MDFLLITLLILSLVISGSLVADGTLENTGRIQFVNDEQ
jgi:hypothetical protein